MNFYSHSYILIQSIRIEKNDNQQQQQNKSTQTKHLLYVYKRSGKQSKNQLQS